MDFFFLFIVSHKILFHDKKQNFVTKMADNEEKHIDLQNLLLKSDLNLEFYTKIPIFFSQYIGSL